MKNEFKVERQDIENISVLYLEGFLDANTIEHLETELQKLLDEKRIFVITDLSRLDYIASAGLGVYMGFIEDFRNSGGDIKLCGMSDKIFKIFDLLGFPTLFDILKNQEECIQKYTD